MVVNKSISGSGKLMALILIGAGVVGYIVYKRGKSGVKSQDNQMPIETTQGYASSQIQAETSEMIDNSALPIVAHEVYSINPSVPVEQAMPTEPSMVTPPESSLGQGTNMNQGKPISPTAIKTSR